MKAAAMFQDHMVLQRNKEVRIFGIGKDHEIISLTFLDHTYQTEVLQGKWMITLPPMQEQESQIMYISGDKDRLEIRDVAVGEVWLAGGQSNMEYYMFFDAEYDKERSVCDDSAIRFFDCPEISYEGQEQDFDYHEMGFWRVCNAENLKYYSAVAYYMAKRLREELHVPVGILGCNWGGTTLSCWMDEAYLQKHGEIWMEEYRQQEAAIQDMEAYRQEFRHNPMNQRGLPFEDPFNLMMMREVPRERQLEMMAKLPDKEMAFQLGPYSPNRPGGLYHTMCEKVAPYSIRGVLWYQGESDAPHADIYKELLKDLIACWRALWREELPFLIVQLPPFEAWLADIGQRFPEIRQAQDEVCREIEETYLVSASDAGMQFDIHPKMKRPIGTRLAFAALSHVYSFSQIEGTAPRAERIEITDHQDGSSELKIVFSHCEDGLILQKDVPVPLIVESDGKTIPVYNISAKGSCLSVSVPKTDKAVIRFAQTPYYLVHLYNSAGIPALPFVLQI